MNFDQAALVDLFRQSFSPLTQLSGGRLALAQAQFERERALRERMGLAATQNQAEMSRQMAMEGMRAQQMFEQQRRTQEFQAALEGLRAENSIEQTATAAALNQRSAEQARTASEFAKARELAASMGIEADPKDPDFVDKVTAEAAKQVKTHRKSATSYARELNAISAQIEKLSSGLDVPEDRQLALARPILIAAAIDDERKAEYKKLTSLDAVMAAAADEPGVIDKISTALQREQLLRNQTFDKRARPLQARQSQLQRTLQALEQRGISPDFEALGALGATAGEAQQPSGDSSELSEDDLGSILPLAPQGGDGSSIPADGGSGPGILQGGAATALLAASPRVRAATKTAARGTASVAGALLKKAPGLGSLGKMGVRGAAGPVGVASFVNDIPAYFGGEPLTASLAGLAVGGFDEKIQRQRAYVNKIDTAIRQASAAGNFDAARKLRALRYAPEVDFNAPDEILGAPSVPATAIFDFNY
jgi:hypothetical protein